jgi:hypothetical protein
MTPSTRLRVKKLLDNPWFYFVLSLAHQCLVILPGEFPVIFPDSGSYLSSNAQRTPLYPFILSAFGSQKLVACFQMVIFALAVAAFSQLARWVIEEVRLPKATNIFVWIGSLYFATNFELIQFTPTILTESLGISLFIFYFYSLMRWWRSRARGGAGSGVDARLSASGLADSTSASEVEVRPASELVAGSLAASDSKYGSSAVYFVLSFLVFPIAAFMLRPSFILVPPAITLFFVLKSLYEKNRPQAAKIFMCLLVYIVMIPAYALWNKPRLGHFGISDIAQHQIFANYMAQGMLMEEVAKPEASPELKSFGEAYEKMAPELRLSQYSLFEKWQQLFPTRNLFQDLVLVNKELLHKRPFGYLKYSLRNMSVVIDGRASFNYLPIENRDLPSKVYYWIQFVLDNLFCGFWFVALVYFVFTLRRRPLFSVENLIFVTVAAQFFTIGFMGYSELRRQAIGVASLQMLFVLYTWAHLMKARWVKQASRGKDRP